MRHILLLAALCATSVWTLSAPAVSDDNDTGSMTKAAEVLNYRLPTDVLPSRYVVELTPYFETQNGKERFTFDGKVEITLRAVQADIRQIVLHVNELEINGTPKLRDSITPLTEIRIVSISNDVRTHKYTLFLEKALPINEDYVLSMQYVGKLSATMRGFYRSSYEENGVTKWLATTQMQPTHAREVFPSFDEPKFKAKFVIKINRPSHFRATVSNTKLERSDSDAGPGLIRDTFAETPAMSTYLVAFIVSEFTNRENAQKNFNVYARPKAYAQTEYAFEIGQKLLAKFDEIFDYKYFSVPEITKMTLAALPDFSAGAMENWGLLTFRETTLLYDSSASTAYAQQRVASVVAHEQAHMWFGDLVTCDWWEYTWLNEGFARYWQYFGTALVETTWDLPEQFVVEQLQAVFYADSLDSTRPMTHSVNTPDEISSVFDSISYNKGASVLRMIEHAIGSDNFKKSIREYLRTNAFRTSTPEKLYYALRRFADDKIDVGAMMDTWTRQAGYPLVTVQVHADRRNVSISQSRFFLKNRGTNHTNKWDIPLNWATSWDNANFNRTDRQFILSKSDNSLEVELISKTDWIIFNVQQTGFYRVNYDEVTWKFIGAALKKSHTDIHVLNRAQIVDDSLNLARANVVNYSLALSTIQYLEKEVHYLPWLAAYNNLGFIVNRFNAQESHLIKKHILHLLNAAYDYLGFQPKSNDTRLDTYNRVNILNLACKYGHKGCIAEAKKEFDRSQATQHNIPVNIAAVVYCTAISEGNKDDWEFLWGRFKKSDVAAEQVLILNALGCTKDPQVLAKYLNHIYSAEVRLQDRSIAFAATLTHSENVQTVFEYVKTNVKSITQSLGNVQDAAKLYSSIVARLTSEDEIAKLEKVVTSMQVEHGPFPKVHDAIASARADLAWANKNIPAIKAYLQPNSGKPSSASTITGITLFAVIVACANAFIF